MVIRKNSIWSSLDWLTVGLYLLLVTLGVINIYSAVYNEGQNAVFNVNAKYGRQLIWIFASLVIAVVTLVLDSKFYSSFAYPIYAFLILLLVGVLLFGVRINGARSWFVIGSIRIQPAEFAKFATTLALAKYFGKYNFNPKKFKTLMVFCLITFLPAVLILLQNDTGSALVFVVFFLVFYREGLSPIYLLSAVFAVILFVLSLLFDNYQVIIFIELIGFLTFYLMYKKLQWTMISAGVLAVCQGALFFVTYYWLNIESVTLPLVISAVLVSVWYLIKIYKHRLQQAYVLLFIFLGAIAYTYTVDYAFNNLLEKHHQHRINHLLGIESDPYGIGYNVNQSKIAIGSGGLTGKGYLQGTQTKFRFVPEQSTDFIFCTVGEEWGFLGTSSVIILFCCLLLRLIYLAEQQKSRFSRVYGYSVACILFFHICINIGMTIGLMPVIGIPLPFFSYGGSSLWGFTLLLFVFLKLDTNRDKLIS